MRQIGAIMILVGTAGLIGLLVSGFINQTVKKRYLLI